MFVGVKNEGRTKVIFASLYIASLLKDNVFLCAS